MIKSAPTEPLAASQSDAAQRRYKPSETRALILSAARELFRSKGFTTTSTLEIAQRAGVAEGSLFYHFGSKKNLLAALGEDYAREMVDAMRRGETDLSRLEPGIIIARAFDYVREHGDVQVPTGLARTSPEIQPFVHANRKGIVNFVSDCIQASHGDCSHEKITPEAAQITASFSYAVVSDAIHHVFETDTRKDEMLTLAETIRYVRSACGYGHLTGIPAIETPGEAPSPHLAEGKSQ